MTRKHNVALLAAVVLAAGLSACGAGDDGAGAAKSGASAAPATRTITHAFGTVQVPGTPQRVVSVGYEEQEFALNFGVVPVLQRDYTGKQPHAVWPWAQPLLKGAKPDTFTEEMPFEKIAAAKPDLILATNSGIDKAAYDKLAAIAPTVARPADVKDWEATWEQQLKISAAIFGQEAKADQQIKEIKDKIAAVKAAHPQWATQTAVSVTIQEQPSVDVAHARGQMLRDFGFQLPEKFAGNLKEGAVPVAFENLKDLDAGVVLWVNGDETPKPYQDLKLRTSLKAHTEGREVYIDKVLTQAFTNGSPAAFQYVFDNVVPLLEAASDGNPATPVKTTVDAGLAAK